MKERLKAWGDTTVLPIAGVFVFNRKGEVLLLQRHSQDLGGGQWGTPGGRIEPDESAHDAAKRELYEETGIAHIELIERGTHLIRMPHGTVHMTSYTAAAQNNIAIVLDPEEHHAYGWFGIEDLLDHGAILWGIPSILRDFGLLTGPGTDPTLADGSSVELLSLAG